MRHRIREFVFKYERHISALSIIAAFIIDSVTLVRVDFYLTQLVLLLYLVVAGVGIIFVNLREAGRVAHVSELAYAWLLIAMQFSFGGLFGRFLIYFGRSGSLEQSWPFLVIFLALLIGNEFAKRHYTKLLLQVSFYYLALFAFFILMVPVLLGSMGDGLFLVSSALSLGVMVVFLRILELLLPGKIRLVGRSIFFTVGSIYTLLNFFYFTNIIPPIPLALHDAGVYHSVVRTAGGYQITREEAPSFFARLVIGHQVVHLREGENAYAYSAVFAPTNFGTSISHIWQKKDEETGEWVNTGSVTFPIKGGQDTGYRGYSIKSRPAPGLWRVSIQNARGQVIGRITFEIEWVTGRIPLIEEKI